MEGLLFFAIAAAVYFVPTIVAAHRGHPQTVSIGLLNLLLGWTLLGWVIALVWSATAFERRHVPPPTGPAGPRDAPFRIYGFTAAAPDGERRGHVRARSGEEASHVVRTYLPDATVEVFERGGMWPGAPGERVHWL